LFSNQRKSEIKGYRREGKGKRHHNALSGGKRGLRKKREERDLRLSNDQLHQFTAEEEKGEKINFLNQKRWGKGYDREREKSETGEERRRGAVE